VRDTPPPIPYREILLTAQIMDMIVDQLRTRRPPISPERGVERIA